MEWRLGGSPRASIMKASRARAEAEWNASTINGSRRRRNGILHNELLYTGRITYNRQRFVKDPETGKRIARPNPEHEWVTRGGSRTSHHRRRSMGAGPSDRAAVLVAMGQQAAEQEAPTLRSSQVRTLRRWHDDQQR